MRFTRLRLENWRNFLWVDVPLQRRVFVVGPNAAGKSNLLDAIRFLRDLSGPRGGLSQAVSAQGRRSVSLVRSLHARANPGVVIDVEADLGERDASDPWRYRLEFGQDNQRRPVVRREQAWHGPDQVLDRPQPADDDPELLSQTHLEQVTQNRAFRQLAEAFSKIRYLHLVPQLVREPDRSVGRKADPFGGDFLEQVAGASEHVRRARLGAIAGALRIAVPQLRELKIEPDTRGVPHLAARYEHWRPNAGWQDEEQLSDGTLRLLGLLWSLLDGKEPLLLEEPELSLHAAVVRQLPQILHRLGRRHGRQVLVSTHSAELLRDPGIVPEEVLLLVPAREGTEVRVASDDAEVGHLLDGGMPLAETVLERAAPPDASQLGLFGD